MNNRVSLPDHEITFMEVGMIKNFYPSAPEFQKYNVLQQSAFFLRKHKTQAVYQRIINKIGFFGVVNGSHDIVVGNKFSSINFRKSEQEKRDISYSPLRSSESLYFNVSFGLNCYWEVVKS